MPSQVNASDAAKESTIGDNANNGQPHGHPNGVRDPSVKSGKLKNGNHVSSSRGQNGDGVSNGHPPAMEHESHFKHSRNKGTDDPRTGTFPRISRPVELIRPSYDVVVIGSGYGGAVAASRMARGGKSVCLLERGKERWPGEFPSDSLPAMSELHLTNAATDGFSGRLARYAERAGGDPTGLYHLILGDGQNAFVGNGLGGTSLLNANVFLEADAGVLELPIWPESLKGHDKWDKCKSTWKFASIHLCWLTCLSCRL